MIKFSLRVTICVPAPMIEDANQFALCVGRAAADAKTFGAAEFIDAAGNLYAVASTVARPAFVLVAEVPLRAPVFAPDVDLAAAARAQSALAVYDPAAPMMAGPDHILAVIDENPAAAIAAAGLSRVPVDLPAG